MKLKSMKVKNIVAACALLTSGLALADSYQTEINASAVHTDIEGFSSNINAYGLGGAYYFNAVETANVPLAEAAFLGKNSKVYADAYRVSKNGTHANTYDVGAEFYISENFLYVDGGVSRTVGNSDSENDWHTSVGITPIDGLLVVTKYGHDQGYDANIAAKYVTAIGGDQFINVETSFIDSDDGFFKQVGADFYFDNSFSVGGSISQQHSDNTYEVRARKFFTEQISGEVSYVDTTDESVIMVGVAVRF